MIMIRSSCETSIPRAGALGSAARSVSSNNSFEHEVWKSYIRMLFFCSITELRCDTLLRRYSSIAFYASEHNHQALASMPRVKNAKNAKTSLGQQLQDIFNVEKVALTKMKAQYRDLAKTYLDCSKTLSGQPGGSTKALKRIREGLVQKFPEFRASGVGATRLEIVLTYLGTYFSDFLSLSHRNRRNSGRQQVVTPKIKQAENDDLYPVRQSSSGTGKAFESAAAKAGQSKVPAAHPVLSDAPDIKEFLEAFNPSLLYLHRTFVEAGIVNKRGLEGMAVRSRPELVGFLQELTYAGGKKLKKVVV
ncbi:hypothetical protein DFH06DRAFT_1288912, partial [Mycena polygramma]